MTCGTLIEFCNEDFPVPPKLPPPPPILSYYFEDEKQANSTFYCDFCSNLEASLDPLHKLGTSGSGGTAGLLSPSQNLTLILLIVALVSAAVGSAVTVVWRKWFRCSDGSILSKALGTSHSSHSADISTTPDGRRRSRTASLGSTSALQNLQKRLSSSSFISRRSVFPLNASSISHHGSHLRSGAATMANNTYCECPSSSMMMMVSQADGGAGGGGGTLMNNSAPISTTTSLSCLPMPSAPTVSTMNISADGNVYAELDPISAQPPPPPQLIPLRAPPPAMLMMPMMMSANGGANQYIMSHRRRHCVPLPPIPTPSAAGIGGDSDSYSLHQDPSVMANNALNINGCCNSESAPPSLVGMNHASLGVLTQSNQQLNMGGGNQMEMNDLNDIYYADLDCKQIQF